MAKDNPSHNIWKENPEIVRRFIELRHDYEQLCAEVQYTLRKRIADKGIEVSTITKRTKTLNSFIGKVQRKNYSNPFDEITDLSGVRVICLYIKDLSLIEEIIRSEFDVIEKVDKLHEKGPDQFGYGAIHFIVRLGTKMAGARYDDLKNLKCEVQIRTVLQDAWAIIDHHLVYKRESAVPHALQRKLNSLAGLFETADDQFEQIRSQRERYVSGMRDSLTSKTAFLANDVNADSIREYLQWKFPDVPVEDDPGQLDVVLAVFPYKNFQTLNQVDTLVNETEIARSKIREALKNNFESTNGKVASVLEFAWAVCLKNDDYFLQQKLSSLWRDTINRYR